MEQQAPHHDPDGPPCTESKLLALHTSTVCLARALVQSGALDRKLFQEELAQAQTCSTSSPASAQAAHQPRPRRVP